MHRLTSITSVALLGTLVAGCADQPPPTDVGFGPDGPPISFAKGKIRGGGFDDAGDVGSVASSFWPPIDWVFLPADIGKTPEEDPEFHRKCVVNGRCSVGSIFESFAGLDTSSNHNRDPNLNADGKPSCCFAVLSTTNFLRDIDDDPKDELIVTTESAIRSLFRLRAVGGWRLQVDLAFLTGERGTRARNDFARIAIIAHGLGGDTVEVIRLEADDPLDWKKPEGCDSVTFGGIRSGYPRCTDWTPYSVDVSQFGGQEIEVEIRVGEVGPDNVAATSLAIDNLKFVRVNLLPVVGPIRLSPSPARVGMPVEASAEFADGDATDTHRAAYNWGDGTTLRLLQVPGSGVVRDRHTYSRPGTYTITLTVADNDRGVGTTRRRITVR